MSDLHTDLIGEEVKMVDGPATGRVRGAFMKAETPGSTALPYLLVQWHDQKGRLQWVLPYNVRVVSKPKSKLK